MPKPLTPRERILRERGLQERQPAVKRHKRFPPATKVISNIPKTPLMKYLEHKYNVALEDLPTTGSLSVVAKKLGNEVDVTTLSKWIKKFKLRYHAGNLPSCEGCLHRGAACDVGICYILMGAELWELIPIKKKEILGEGN